MKYNQTSMINKQPIENSSTWWKQFKLWIFSWILTIDESIQVSKKYEFFNCSKSLIQYSLCTVSTLSRIRIFLIVLKNSLRPDQGQVLRSLAHLSSLERPLLPGLLFFTCLKNHLEWPPLNTSLMHLWGITILVPPPAKTAKISDTSDSRDNPILWNSLPHERHESQLYRIIVSYRKNVKTHLLNT